MSQVSRVKPDIYSLLYKKQFFGRIMSPKRGHLLKGCPLSDIFLIREGKIMAEKKGFFAEFKEFISRGSVMDMAVGVVVGGAFTSIVTALVDSIINPIITRISGNADFSDVVIGIFPIGQLISAVINFLLISFVVFIMVKTINDIKEASEKKLQEMVKKKANGEEVEEEKEEEAPITETSLLLEIRDLLKAQAEATNQGNAVEKTEE